MKCNLRVWLGGVCVYDNILYLMYMSQHHICAHTVYLLNDCRLAVEV